MIRNIPHPILTVSVIVMWVLLNRLSVGHLLLGAAVGVIAGKAMSALRPPKVQLGKWWRIPGLVGLTLFDIALSNVTVARQILRGGGAREPGFVEMRLRLRDPLGLGILAIILTSTPGTAWAQYDRATGRLLLHVLDLSDGTDWPAWIADRYESRLLEIFV